MNRIQQNLAIASIVLGFFAAAGSATAQCIVSEVGYPSFGGAYPGIANPYRDAVQKAQARMELRSLSPQAVVPARRAKAYADARALRLEASQQQLASARGEFELQRERRQLYAAQQDQWKAEGVYLPVVDLSRPLAWPTVLRGVPFVTARKEIDSLVDRSTKLVSTASEVNREELRERAEQLRDELKSRIGTLPAERYIEGRRFLEELIQATRRPQPAVTASAVRLAAK